MRVVRALLAVLFISVLLAPSAAATQSGSLPAQLTDAEFARLFTEFSEPSGDYPYQNFMTNEETIQDVMPVLTKVAKPGGVYLGVAPEQNFTYIAGLKPKMAFIFDIRRQNAILHLMYKALFEMSPTRGDFVSNLFSVKTPNKAPVTANAVAVFETINDKKGDREFYRQNLASLQSILARHRVPLSAEDLKKIEFVYDVFFRAGPKIDYKFESSFPPNMAPAPNYAEAMTDTDANRKQWSFLATEDNYRVVRDLHLKNLIIPVVGDFAGPTALRKVADYLKQHNATVSAFYLSNVEIYLEGTNYGGSMEKLQSFYQNAAALPLDASSFFIRFVGSPGAVNLRWWKGGWLQTVSPMADLTDKIKAGEKPTFAQAIQMIPDPKTLAR
jgi:hypothetical protein